MQLMQQEIFSEGFNDIHLTTLNINLVKRICKRKNKNYKMCEMKR